MPVDTFPLGWYDYSAPTNHGSPALIANIPSNVILVYYRGVQPMSDLLGYLDAVRAAGLKAIVEIAPLNKTPSLVGGQFDPVALQQFISTLKGRPEIWAWYLYDEPPGNDQVGPDKAKEAYQIIKQEDTQRPVAIVVSDDISLEYAFLYRDATDVIMFDYYQGFDGAKYFLKLTSHGALATSKAAYWPVIAASGTLPQY